METEYLKIGELKIIDGEAFVKPDYYDDSLTAGNIFKDAEAYDKDWDAICYVPEYGVSRFEDDEDGCYGDIKPTHWMPIPPLSLPKTNTDKK